MPDPGERAAVLLIDTHVHLYDVFDVDALFDAAAANLGGAAAGAGLAGSPRELMLLLTETARDDAFTRLSSGDLRPLRWQVQSTHEPAVIRVTNGVGPGIWVVAGRQIATGEDLEVLALGTTGHFPDGQSIERSLEFADRSAAMTVLPWGFGKWWGGRGRKIAELLRVPRSRPLFLGDNAGRLALGGRPALLVEGERRGHRILPGTDPLPFPGEERKVGSFGLVLRDWVLGERPLQRCALALSAPDASAQPFGRLTGLLPFLKLQVSMQLRKRLARRSGTTG